MQCLLADELVAYKFGPPSHVVISHIIKISHIIILNHKKHAFGALPPFPILKHLPTPLKLKSLQSNFIVLSASERDTYRGNTIENRGCLFIYLDICLDVHVCMSFCTLTLRIFVFAPRSTPSQTSLNRILWCSDHYPYHLRN